MLVCPLQIFLCQQIAGKILLLDRTSQREFHNGILKLAEAYGSKRVEVSLALINSGASEISRNVV